MTLASATAASRSASWRQFKAILKKDIVMELRTREMVTSMGLYTLLTMVVYMVAITAAGRGLDARLVSPGLLWTAFVFTSMLGLNRSFVHEKDQGCIEALLLSPVDRPIIFLGKAVGNLIFLLIVEVITLPVFIFMFLADKPIEGPIWMIALSLLVGSIGIAGVGTLLATMSVNTKGKDFILAVLFVPIMFPLLYAAVAATSAVIIGDPGYAEVFWRAMGIAAGYDVVMIVAAYGLYEFIIGA